METWGVWHMQGCHACCCSLSRHEKDQTKRVGDVTGSGTCVSAPSDSASFSGAAGTQSRLVAKWRVTQMYCFTGWDPVEGRGLVWQRGTDAKNKGKRFYIVKQQETVVPLQRWDRWPSTYLQKCQLYPVIRQDERLSSNYNLPTSRHVPQSASC